MPGWWASLRPELWSFVGTARQAAALGVLADAGTRTAMVSLDQLRALMVGAGYDEPLSLEDVRDTAEALQRAQLATPYRNWSESIGSLREGRLRGTEAWGITTKGRSTLKAVRDTTARLERPLQIPSRMLDVLADRLSTLLEDAERQPEELAGDLADITAHLDRLQSAAGDFYAAMAALDQEDVTLDEVFHLHRQRILMVLQEFIVRAQSSVERARAAARALHEFGHGRIAELAVPGVGLLDAEGGRWWSNDVVAMLDDLLGWLEPGGSIDALIAVAGDAIGRLLGAIGRRFQAHARGSDIGADFRMLARLLHAQPDDRSAGQLFAAATGLWESRHVHWAGLEQIAPLQEPEFGEKTQVRVVLRKAQPPTPGPRRGGRVSDAPEARAQARALQARKLALEREACRDLCTDEPVELTHFAGAPRRQAQLLVSLVQRARRAADPGTGIGVADTGACRIWIHCSATGELVTVVFEEGSWTYPRIRVQIRLVGRITGADAAAA